MKKCERCPVGTKGGKGSTSTKKKKKKKKKKKRAKKYTMTTFVAEKKENSLGGKKNTVKGGIPFFQPLRREKNLTNFPVTQPGEERKSKQVKKSLIIQPW